MTALQHRRQVTAALRHLRTSGLRLRITRFSTTMVEYRWFEGERMRVSLRLFSDGAGLTVRSRDVDVELNTADVRQVLDALVFARLLPATFSAAWCAGYRAGQDAFRDELTAGLAAYDIVVQTGQAVRP